MDEDTGRVSIVMDFTREIALRMSGTSSTSLRGNLRCFPRTSVAGFAINHI